MVGVVLVEVVSRSLESVAAQRRVYVQLSTESWSKKIVYIGRHIEQYQSFNNKGVLQILKPKIVLYYY